MYTIYNIADIGYYFYYYIYIAKLVGNSGNGRTSLPVAVQRRSIIYILNSHYNSIVPTFLRTCRSTQFLFSYLSVLYLSYKNTLDTYTLHNILSNRRAVKITIGCHREATRQLPLIAAG